jgi:S-adenosylmethionine hydrolase
MIKIVTMLTDFGLSDSYVAQMKGVILSKHPDARLIDITHDVPAQDILYASRSLSNVWSYFPKGTIHMVVVDPAVGTSRERLVVESRGHYFVAPDNGVLSFLSQDPTTKFYNVNLEQLQIQNPSFTFEGRDVFAPAVNAILSGMRPNEIGYLSKGICQIDFPKPQVQQHYIEGEIISFDHFGNMVTNISKDLVGGLEYQIQVGNIMINRICRTYADAKEGELMALVNSSGYLELSISSGNAKEKYRFLRGQKVKLIKVH